MKIKENILSFPVIFTVSFEKGQSDACGGHLFSRNEVQWFTSPLFSYRSYPDNLVCDWIITAPSSTDIITLQVSLEYRLNEAFILFIIYVL